MPPIPACAGTGPPSSEVTGAFCRVPSTPFAQTPGYALPVHPCRFRVRSWCRRCFPEGVGRPSNPIRRDDMRPSSRSAGWGVLTPFPSATALALALGARLTLRGMTLRRNPWTFGVRGSHPHDATHVSIRTSDTSTRVRTLASQAYGTLRYRGRVRGRAHPQLRCVASAPLHFRRGTAVRPVSYYAFFKGWLLLSQPPGCLGLPTSFPT